ncbi:MAG: hypothetical protein Kow0092_31320 [Deferrisomatales bacterium]
MDANGQRFWMVAEGDQLDLSDTRAAWEPRRRVLRLASRRRLPHLPADRERARLRADGPPFTLDEAGTWAAALGDRRQVTAFGAFDDPEGIYTAPLGERVLDLSLGREGVLYLAVGSDTDARVMLLDRRDRWGPVALAAEGFRPDRIVAAADGGAWAFDRGRGRVGRVRGLPLRRRPFGEYAPGTARPCGEDPDPPRLELRGDLALPPGRELVAAAPTLTGGVGLLLWGPGGEEAEIALLGDRGLAGPARLPGARAPFSLGWVEGNRWAVLFEGVGEAIVYALGAGGEGAQPVGDRYPLVGWEGDRFVNALAAPVRYPSRRAQGSDARELRALHRLSAPGLARAARVALRSPFDSGSPRTEWHRIYLEAALPAGTGVRVLLRAADDPGELAAAAPAEHRFGAVPGVAGDPEGVPAGAWVPAASEIPFHPGLLDCPRRPGQAGLFTALVQRAGRVTRALRGRYLAVELELLGDGHRSPEVAAVRLYGPRFSYVDRYLPELYRETEFGPRAEAEGPATGPDFLQRFLGLFEGILTPLEDRVAAAHLVTDPVTAPADALDWLAGWVGLSLEPGLPVERKRSMVRHATRLYRARGTPRGLALALDLATGGAVARGEVVLVEDFRLRRTFATILGADLADEDDPLLAGLVASGNSYVGDTLFLGEEEKKEFLALFAPELSETPAEREAVAALFDRLAHRITVLVHREASPEELGFLRRVVTLETPAHVAARVLAASHPLRVGLSALTGVDTYLRPRAAPEPARAGRTYLGRKDFVLGRGTLDPRLEGAGAPEVQPGMRRPVARARNVTADLGESFTLDASDSEAYEGRQVVRYRWEQKQ